jgi:NTE family protein
MEQVQGLQFNRLDLANAARVAPTPLWFSIDGTLGAQRAGDPALASSIGTNLKKLSDPELAVLTRHGGALAEHLAGRYAPELVTTS